MYIDKIVLLLIYESAKEDLFLKAAGSWKNTIDCEKLIKDIYEARKINKCPN
ncbi:hypothetical protein MCHI_002947 [Candidatus Magnetoovum chiemensis]|nr:hypothetical protein MCHI_002947 [Candidatus Magnetoovum chiemensis]